MRSGGVQASSRTALPLLRAKELPAQLHKQQSQPASRQELDSPFHLALVQPRPQPRQAAAQLYKAQSDPPVRPSSTQDCPLARAS